MKDIQDQIDKYEGILWDLENANRLSNPSDDKKKKKKIEQTKKKIASLKSKLDENKTMRLSKRHLRQIISGVIKESYLFGSNYREVQNAIEQFVKSSPTGATTAEIVSYIKQSFPKVTQTLSGQNLKDDVNTLIRDMLEQEIIEWGDNGTLVIAEW